MHLDWPILRTASAALGSFLVVVLVHVESLVAADPSITLAGWFALGLLYTQFFEYWSHRFPMHRRIRFLEGVRFNHLQHHRIFHGERFQVRGGPALSHIPGRYWVFPLLFLLHYAILYPLLEVPALVAFLLGAVVHYLAFEWTHWLTHIEDNAFDRVIARVPLLGPLREYQIEHHRMHHEIPEMAFNFNPPYLGDRLFGNMPAVVEAPQGALAPASFAETPAPVVIEPPVPSRWGRPLVRYGSVAAVGVALLGAAVIAHGFWSSARGTTSSESSI